MPAFGGAAIPACQGCPGLCVSRRHPGRQQFFYNNSRIEAWILSSGKPVFQGRFFVDFSEIHGILRKPNANESHLQITGKEHPMLHLIIHSLEDTAKLLPFLYLTYLAMEYLEHKLEGKTDALMKKAGRFGPLCGGILGVRAPMRFFRGGGQPLRRPRHHPGDPCWRCSFPLPMRCCPF